MKSIPRPQQNQGPGVRLVAGSLLNRIAEAIKARTPLNAGSTSAKGYAPATGKGSAQPPKLRAGGPWEPGRTYVVSVALLARFAADLRARTPTDEAVRASPRLAADAEGLRALLRSLEWISPDTVTSWDAQGFRQQPAGARTARLRVEAENKTVYADVCALSMDAGAQTYLTQETTTNIFANGSYVITATASGVIRTWVAGSSPADCSIPEYDSTFDSEFDYGAFVDSDYSPVTTPFSSVYAAAVAALAGATPASSHTDYSWLEDQWRAASAAGGWTGGGWDIGVNYDSGINVQYALTTRWRAINQGQCQMKIFWERRNTGGSVVASGTLSLRPGQTSAWQEPPAASSDPAARLSLTLSRINLGPYR